MSEDAAVAIVVRTKDRPAFLRRALASIAGQTFADFECVVINDGGDPAPVDAVIADVPEQLRSRFRAIHAPDSRGRWKSANAGVLGTTAPLIVLHDDDDTWHPDFLARATDYLRDHPQRDGVVARTEIVWEVPGKSGYRVRRREIFQPQLHDILLGDVLAFNRFVPIGFLYRRSLHEELGLYDDRLPVVGDWEFNLRILRRGPLEYLGGEPLAYWHQRAGQGGDAGNSVIDASGDHARYDALLRDEALRPYIEEHGIGMLLYLTGFIEKRFRESEAAFRAEILRTSLGHRFLAWIRRVFNGSEWGR